MKKWLEQSFNFLSQSKIDEKKYSYQFSIDEPERISPWVIYIVGERSSYWMITFKCPCGCDSAISLNLLKGVRPRWKFKTKKGEISISPSVWRRVGCRSHFYIRKGRIDWSDIREWS